MGSCALRLQVSFHVFRPMVMPSHENYLGDLNSCAFFEPIACCLLLARKPAHAQLQLEGPVEYTLSAAGAEVPAAGRGSARLPRELRAAQQPHAAATSAAGRICRARAALVGAAAAAAGRAAAPVLTAVGWMPRSALVRACTRSHTGALSRKPERTRTHVARSASARGVAGARDLYIAPI